jgi:hypothetical protein
MSRTTLCVLTAAVLGALALGIAIVRCQVLGEEARAPVGANTWKVTMVVQGYALGDAKLQTCVPLDFDRQHILRESWQSSTFLYKPPTARHPERRLVHWTQKAGTGEGHFRARYEFYCAVDPHRQTTSMSQVRKQLYAPPQPGQYLEPLGRDGAENERLAGVARQLTTGMERPADQVEALYHFVARDIVNEPGAGGPGMKAAECLDSGSGDAGGKSRLLAALLRDRGIPARIVTGLTPTRGAEQSAHRWVEAWVDEHWTALCPFYRHYGRVPPTYLILGYGDQPVVRGRKIRDLICAFLIEKTLPGESESGERESALRRTFRALSLFMLPPQQQRYAEFLLLMPAAALIVCVFRNLIGLHSFGMFAPALVGLAFRDLHSMPGLLVFVSILLVGWLIRRVLEHYHLLQVPRVAVMLSLVVILLLAVLITANLENIPAAEYVPFFPMVILTGMIERFWTLETEDTTSSSFKTLVSSLGIAVAVALLINIPGLSYYLFCFPELLLAIIALQLLIGRYTGYRLMELLRFRDFLREPAGDGWILTIDS